MKRFLLFLLFVSSLGFAQSSGITYQAVIYNPNGEELPGVDNPYAPLTNQDVCLQFDIVDADGNQEYQEEVQVTTDAFGMVNLLIGTNTQTGGYAADFAGVEWTADTKFLVVDLDIKGSCIDFEELSNQPFTYVPFAYYSPASDVPGPEGPPGPVGPQGEPGPAGADGQDGVDGQDGAVGATGPAGAVGPTGPTGPSGQAGPQGIQGDIGPAGADGLLDPGDNTGDIVYWNGTQWTILPIGLEGDVLTVINGVPSWGQVDSSSGTVPPPDLNVGDLWGGGVVTYIAQPNDLLYVEGEIHGLVAPLNWLDIGGTSNPLAGWPPSAAQNYTSQAIAEIGGGEFNTYLYFSVHPNNTNNDPNYWDAALYPGNWIGSYGFCLNLELNGYDDWFVPNQNEIMTLLNLSSSLDQLTETPPYPSENFANDLNHGYYEGFYIISGSYHPSFGVLPGAINHQPGSTAQGWERTVPMRYF